MKKAIIYVRDNNKEMQEVRCRLYASHKGYKVLFVTSDLNDVNNCDILLVANHSRISRDQAEYSQVLNDLRNKSIAFESVIDRQDYDASFGEFIRYHRI